jgi:lysophospholipase L1-like esterase
MKKTLTLLTLIAHLGGSACIASEKIHILCLGDSITQGGRSGRDEFTYRWPLFCMLVDAGVRFDFIGSKNNGLNADAKWPAEYKGVPFDPDHEGIYGIKTQAALDRLPAAMTNWMATPDIALIHLGTNDKKADQPNEKVKEPLRKIIELLREKNPKVVILLGQLNFNDSPGAFRIMAAVTELKNEMNTDESPVRTVPHYQNWQENPKAPNADTFDWAHPNPQGQKKMAEQWFAAMQPWLHSSP